MIVQQVLKKKSKIQTKKNFRLEDCSKARALDCQCQQKSAKKKTKTKNKKQNKTKRSP